jgi:hypothetical protein
VNLFVTELLGILDSVLLLHWLFMSIRVVGPKEGTILEPKESQPIACCGFTVFAFQVAL